MKREIKIFESIVDNLLDDEAAHPVSEYVPVNKLSETFDLSLGEDAIKDGELKRILTDIVLKTPKTASKMFFNQLFGGRKSKAVLGDLLAVMLNNSMYTYKAAGPQIAIEKQIIMQTCKLIGYGEGSNGIIAPGGSLSNFMAVIMARDSFGGKIREQGVISGMRMYTSVESHYSNRKNATFAGIGTHNVRYVKADKFGKMIPEDLEKLVQEDLSNGLSPFFVNATAGTTVLGAYDPIEEIAAICEKYKLWFHVDGVYGGAVLFSDKYKHLIKGIEKTDSVSINAHKMLGTPLTCSFILTRHNNCLYHSFSSEAEYLYQTDGDEYNPGKISLQCGRRNDALKLWTLWKSVGTRGLAELVEKQFMLADVARNYIKSNPDYELYSFDESVSVCFNYKSIPANKLCAMLYEKSEIMVGYGTFREDEFIRLVTVNSENSPEDILLFFKKLEDFVTENPQLLNHKSNSMSS